MKKKFCFLLAFVLININFLVYAQGVSQEEYDSLKEQYEALRKDRDNLLLQMKRRQTQSPECQAIKDKYENLKLDRDNLALQVKNLLQYKSTASQQTDARRRLEGRISRLEQEKQALEAKINDLEAQLTVAFKEREALIGKQDELKKYIEKKEIEYKIIDTLEDDLRRAGIEKKRLTAQSLQLQEKIKELESEKIALKAEGKIYQRQIRNLKKQYSQALRTNRQLEKKLQEVPKKFAEIARENKVLIKETALMHYNLGVFYIEEGQYRRAVAELEKAVELNPDDAYAYFNLGYIYAEYLINRTKAVDCFKQYLKLASKEDAEIDWVKRYILTWQTWEGKGIVK